MKKINKFRGCLIGMIILCIIIIVKFLPGIIKDPVHRITPTNPLATSVTEPVKPPLEPTIKATGSAILQINSTPMSQTKKSLAIQFLIDESASAERCEEEKEIRYRLPVFMFTMLEMLDDSYPNESPIVLGFARFGPQGYKRVLPLTALSNIKEVRLADSKEWFSFLQRETPYGEFDGYVTALTEVLTDLKKVDTDKKSLIFITDGSYTMDEASVENNPESIKSKLIDIKELATIHLFLLCEENLPKKQLEFWTVQSHIQDPILNEKGSFSTIHKLFADILGGSLPPIQSSGWISTTNATLNVPGYARSAHIDLVSWDKFSPESKRPKIALNTDLFGEIELESAPQSMLWHWSTAGIRLDPPMDCISHSWQLKNVDQDNHALAFYHVKYLPPKFLSSRSTSKLPQEEVIGDNDLTYGLGFETYSTELSTSEYKNFLECFVPSIQTNTEGIILSKPNNDWANNEIYWKLLFPLSGDKDITLKLGFLLANKDTTLSNDTQFIPIETLILPVRFKPAMREATLTWICEHKDKKECEKLKLNPALPDRGFFQFLIEHRGKLPNPTYSYEKKKKSSYDCLEDLTLDESQYVFEINTNDKNVRTGNTYIRTLDVQLASVPNPNLYFSLLTCGDIIVELGPWSFRCNLPVAMDFDSPQTLNCK